MAGTIGTKIELGGEKSFRQAVSAIKTEMQQLSSAAALTTEQYKDNDKSLDALTKSTENYQKEAEAHRKNIEKLTEALESAKKQYGEDSKMASKWQTELNKEQTALIKSERAIKENNQQIDKMTSLTGKVKSAFDGWKSKTDELKEKHETLYKGMKKVGDVSSSIAKGGLKVLGAAGGAAVGGIAAIGAAAVKAGKELGKLMQQAAEAGDTIDDESQKIGVSAEQYQILSYQAELSGTSIQTISKAAAKLKSSGSDLDVDEAIKKIAAIKDPAERSAAAVEMFGAKTAQELTPMLNAGTEGLRDMEKAARDNGMVMSNEAVAAASNFNDSLATLKETATAMKNNLVSELLPGATQALDGLTGMLTGKEGAAEQLKAGVEDMIKSFREMLPKALEIVKGLAGALLEVAPELVISLADGIIDNLSPLLESALEIISELTQGLLTEENIRKIVKAATDLVINLADFLADNVDLVIDSAFILVDSLFDGLTDGDSMEKLINAALKIVEKVCTGLIDNIPALLDAAFQLAVALADALIHYDWWSLAKKIFASIKSSLKSLITGQKSEDDPAPTTQPTAPKKHETGLRYVPYDGYLAELHEGERVLTAYEAQTYSSSGSAESASEVRALRRELSAMRDDIRRYGVPVDVKNGKQLGRAMRT